MTLEIVLKKRLVEAPHDLRCRQVRHAFSRLLFSGQHRHSEGRLGFSRHRPLDAGGVLPSPHRFAFAAPVPKPADGSGY
jgi:hypothetical protein